MEERYYTVKEAAGEYFQGKVSAREVYGLFKSGHLRGFRVGTKILIYQSSLDAYRLAHENGAPPLEVQPPSPMTNSQGAAKRRRANGTPAIRLNRLPEG